MKYFLLLISSIWCNPFSIPFHEKSDVTIEDYLEIQRQIREVHIEPLLSTLYPDPPPVYWYGTFQDFRNRCSKGRDQIIIDPEKGFYPEKNLIKVGEGGENCIVCYGSFNGKYAEYVRTLINGLIEQKFNGYFYYRIGGFPNPTGKEITYAAVPYCFKIFLMLEAQKLGFTKVLWVDSACYPIWNIDYLYQVIEEKGALINWWINPNYLARYILPQTKDLLLQLTGTDVVNGKYVSSAVFGLKMDDPKVRELIDTYYQFVRLGTPFLSCFPEDFVLNAIIGQPQFHDWTDELVPNILEGYFHLREGR